MQQGNDSHVKHLVMVRAWGDEPVKLFLHRIENNRCYVGNERASRPIGLPLEQVFAFSEDRFSTIFTQFSQGDMRKLSEEWAKLGVDDFACNKYQDTLCSAHDQEHVTDFECTQGRNGQ